MWLSALNVQYRDVKYAVPFLLQLWLFATPIMLPGQPRSRSAGVRSTGAQPDERRDRGLPLALLGERARLVRGSAMSASVTVVLFALGVLYFRRAEELFATSSERPVPSDGHRQVTVDRLSKEFVIGSPAASCCGRRLDQLVRAPFGAPAERETIWALQDVSFDVSRARCSGSIGRNGAGKSTLLKILSRITEPTAGTVSVSGRVGSPARGRHGLSPGADGPGEHLPERRHPRHAQGARSTRKFDEIVAFAEVERFIDTPVKRYSSGMYAAAGVRGRRPPRARDPDRRRGAGGRRRRVPEEVPPGRWTTSHGGGRTVLFVCHNLAAIENLCSRAIWIDNGRVREDGSPKDVIGSYMATFADSQDQAPRPPVRHRASGLGRHPVHPPGVARQRPAADQRHPER